MAETSDFYLASGPQIDALEDPFEDLQKLPGSDFSLGLQIPEDLDGLFRSLGEFGLNPELHSLDRCEIGKIWERSGLGLAIIDQRVAECVGNLDDNALARLAHDWNPAQPEQPRVEAALRKWRDLCRKGADESLHLLLFAGDE